MDNLELRVRDLIRMAQRDYELNDAPYAKVFPYQVTHVLRELGDTPVAELGYDDIEEYKALRIKAGAARATVSHELCCLRKGFRVAVDARIVAAGDIPVIRDLRPGPPRTGFIAPDDAERIFAELRPDPRDVACFAYWSGWRRGEVFGLTWDRTNEEWVWCRDKNGETKHAPLHGRLGAVLERRRAKRSPDCDHVFHRRGRPIRCMRDGWSAAVRRAGFPGTLFHDMRRSFCRNGIRAGIDRDTVMKLSGHKTDEVFRRYNIQNEQDLIDAAKRLEAFGG